MTTEEKFHAAVNVIRSLPKNGSYQPSTDLMLRFYGYFKQATQGPCSGRRPGFWDIVGRAKYDAWKNMGNMPKQEAMKRYVDELHTIVETMSYSDKVASFLEAPSDELEGLNASDLELIVGDVIERVRSQPNSPLASREGSPHRLLSSLGSSRSTSPSVPEDSDHSDDEYIDTIEAPEPKKIVQNGTISEHMTNGVAVYREHKSRARSKPSLHQDTVDISHEVARAVQSLKSDIERLTKKVNSIESSSRTSNVIARKKHWLFGGISPQFLAFIIAWPFIATFIMNRFFIKKRL